MSVYFESYDEQLRRLAWKTATDKAHDDLIYALYFLKAAIELEEKAGFKPDQARIPQGQRDGGQWAREGGTHERLRETAQSEQWGNHKTLREHFNRHYKDFNAKSPKDYARQANGFLKEIETKKMPTVEDRNGIIRSYDPQTNRFGSYNADGTTRTYYKPAKGASYFTEQINKDIKRGGRVIEGLPENFGGRADPLFDPFRPPVE